MNAPALTRAEFLALLAVQQDEMQARRAAEHRRLARCAQLSALIAEVLDQHPGKGFRQVAAELPVDEGTRLLALIDQLEIESQCRQSGTG
jgi:hypothetical protein